MSKLTLGFLAICIVALSKFRIGYAQTFDVLQFDAVGDGETDDSQAFLRAWDALCGATGNEDKDRDEDEYKYEHEYEYEYALLAPTPAPGGSEDDNSNRRILIPTLIVPPNKTFLLQPIQLSGPCKSTSLQLQILGKLIAPKSRDEYWEDCEDKWITFSEVTNLIVDGNGTGEINGNGVTWWGKSTKRHKHKNINDDKKECSSRPRALHFERCDHLELRGVRHVDSPKAHIGIKSCNNVSVSNLHILAPQESPNTDGIDISTSTCVNIHDSTIGTGDDCIAINNGSSYIIISNIVCGPGHGISVGSLGEDGTYETVEEVHVTNCTFNGTDNGARIKTWQGGSGYARGISFENITVIRAKNPIIIDQYYCDKGGDGCKTSDSAVNVSDVTFRGFKGTHANEEEAIIFDCSQSAACLNITVNEINITSALDPHKNISASCHNVNGTFDFRPCSLTFTLSAPSKSLI